ncbi:MAG: hypothetical protein HYR71_02000 [Chloroflexi bacterium]|nr:hypothetical protein [Chloroflexota bacterium]
MEGTRRAQELKMLEAELPNLEWTLKFAERPRANPRRINLSMDEWHVSSSINPRNSIRHIAEANNLSEFQIRKIVHRLLAMGWVQLVQPERLRSAAAAAPLPAPPPGRARLPQSGA